MGMVNKKDLHSYVNNKSNILIKTLIRGKRVLFKLLFNFYNDHHLIQVYSTLSVFARKQKSHLMFSLHYFNGEMN